MFIIHRIVFILNLIAILLLLGSYAAPYASPQVFWPLALLGIAYPLLVIINFIFIIYWTIFFKLKVLFSIAAIFAGTAFMPRIIQISPKHATQKEALVKVMSYNCKYFGYFDKFVDTSPFFELLKTEQPDILCFQEFFCEQSKRRNYVKKTQKASSLTYQYISESFHEDDSAQREFGLYIASRYPIIDSGFIVFPLRLSNRCQWATVKIGDDTIRVYNIHLESNHLDWDDYKIMQASGQDTTLARAGNIINKLKKAWQNRATQAELVADHVQNCPYPVLVCGDFNDTPLSYAYQKVAGNLKDAFIESGSGISQTYSGPLPSFRIDYITGSKSFSYYDYQLHDRFFSDHKVISALVNVSPKTP